MIEPEPVTALIWNHAERALEEHLVYLGCVRCGLLLDYEVAVERDLDGRRTLICGGCTTGSADAGERIHVHPSKEEVGPDV